MLLPVLKVEKISKRFTHPVENVVFENLDLSVRRGESIAIGGRSGEGKSTLLQLLGTLDTPTSGIIEIMGTRSTPFNRALLRNTHIGFIFQSFYLLQDSTALDNVLMPARIARKPVHKGSEAYKRAVLLLDRVGLSHRLHHQAKLLSGGEKQRVAIARALCNDPDLLLADEPTGNLDRRTAEEIHSLLLSFAKEENKTLIVVTHDPALMSLCQKHYQLQHKQLVSVD